MAGHSHWKQIKHQKGAADQKRGQLFSKLLNTISIAARSEPDPKFNSTLRSAIEKAKSHNVPQVNIERAIKQSPEDKDLQKLTIEAYASEGVAIIIEAITDNKNRTIAEIRAILNNHQAKMAEPGSAHWTFEKNADGWQPKFQQTISPSTRIQISALIRALEEHHDIQKVITNI